LVCLLLHTMSGFRFSKFLKKSGQTEFDRLFDLFRELLNYTAGDLAEALDWMNQLDRQHQITNSNYGMGDFIKDLKEKGFIKENSESGEFEISSKTEQSMRQNALEEIFGKLKKAQHGSHRTVYTGKGDESTGEVRPFQFGDSINQIAVSETMKNAYSQLLGGSDSISEDDLMVVEREHTSQTSTVLMIDISHSMILYGEDRITPAKKVAMALAELIKTKYPKDTLDIIVFGNDAWQIEIKDLPYLKVGPYHTNTVAGLRLAQDLLRRRKNQNKQIFMITDGKPSCLKEAGGYYMNSFGLDRKIVNKCLNEAAICRRLKIPITTFMIARDPYLQSFVEEFTQTNNGRAFYTGLKGLGDIIFKDFEGNRTKKV
jgi:Ca-activated chloride channel family protein